MTDLIPALAPCPICHGQAEIERPGSRRQSMIVACTQCGLRLESGDVLGLTPPERWQWNRRASPPGHDDLLAALKEALETLTAEDACNIDPIVGSDNPHENAAGLVSAAIDAALSAAEGSET